MTTTTASSRKIGLVRIRKLDRIRPTPENVKGYRPVDPDFPDIQDLANSIAENGVLVPLVVSADGWLLSGHRRYEAARLADLKDDAVHLAVVRGKVLDLLKDVSLEEF